MTYSWDKPGARGLCLWDFPFEHNERRVMDESSWVPAPEENPQVIIIVFKFHLPVIESDENLVATGPAECTRSVPLGLPFELGSEPEDGQGPRLSNLNLGEDPSLTDRSSDRGKLLH